ncbi:uroporphyrinogen-III C-methyltransferase [Desulfonatronum thioautotrophicum]|uniref:uroporphyrinogen-III C-methyltransferase n=1 Tax=Desulfonatronum thioautotrophicum TaxID=617001 RepID=UPI0005EB2ED7|nr:uroporphyrinogen-III C-methyltransferase [Desulfonatronum thioautotrophicum]
MSKVYLLGAGPGDPELITLKAKRLLESADTVVYDYLANPRFLAWCRPDAEIYYVGKKGGDHTLPQDKINDLLVERAKAGKIVARLKGGDPYVFGRGAEEVEELLEHGIAFEVVPGVTSAVAAPAYAGIPLTHRRFASSVSFITGHEDPTKTESAHDWEALARGTSTLVFFMGVKNLPEISANLIKAGRPGNTPAALVRWGTTCRQRSLISTLADIAEQAQKQRFSPPSLLVVGEVVSLHDKLNWFEKRPLLGKGVVVTRSREQASDVVASLENLGACCHEFPTIAVAPMENKKPIQEAAMRLGEYDWVVFTSVNGVRTFWEVLEDRGMDARAFAGTQVAAIGPATAEGLARRGIRADFVPEKYVAEDIAQGLLDRDVAGKRVLIPRAKEAREVLPEELLRAGAQVEVLPVYRTLPVAKGAEELATALENGEIHYITFTSSSTVTNFFAAISRELIQTHRARLQLVCIGPVTEKTLQSHGFQGDIQPENYTIPDMVRALLDHATQGKQRRAET